MISRNELAELTDHDGFPAVSVLLPTHVAGREIRQDPVRLRNLLDVAAERLAALGQRRPEIEELLRPAAALLADEEFWRHQESGLALFIAPGFFRRHRLAGAMPEEVVVGRHFHVKHLLPHVGGGERFHLLAVSAGSARLYDGTRFALAPREDVALPASVAEISAETDYENERHASPVARPRSGAPGGIPKTHNLGDDPEAQRKAQLLEYLRRIAAAVEAARGTSEAPLVLAAAPEIQGNFRALSPKHLAEKGIEANPDALSEEELHDRAWAIVEAGFAAGGQAALDRFASLSGSSDGKATTKIDVIVRAASAGRVDTLFVAEDAHLWGVYDPAADRVEAHGSAAAGDDDLLDYAALATLRGGGRVDVRRQDDMPRRELMAAILRY